LEILDCFENIQRQNKKFQTILKWLGDKTTLKVLKKFTETESSLNFDTIEDCIQRLFDKISDSSFEKHIIDNLHSVTSPHDLTVMILTHFNGGLVLRNHSAGKKIKLDLAEHLKLIEKEEPRTIDEKEVYDNEIVN